MHRTSRVIPLCKHGASSPKYPTSYTSTLIYFVFSFRHAAASYGEMEVLEYLLSIGGNISLLDEDGDTPLLVSEKPEIFARLVAAGADPHAKNTEGRGILDKAVEDDNEELIVWLQQNGYVTDPDFKYVPGQTEMEDFVSMLERVDEGEGDAEGEEGDAATMGEEDN